MKREKDDYLNALDAVIELVGETSFRGALALHVAGMLEFLNSMKTLVQQSELSKDE